MSPNAPEPAPGRIRRWAGSAAAMLTCAALAACGTASAAPQPPRATAPAPIVAFVRDGADLAAVSLPVERYLLTPAQNSAIDHAMWILVSRCMRAHGFDLAVPAEPAGQRAGSEVARRYGPTDLAQAEAYGYHDPPHPGPATGAASSLSALSAAERQVFGGDCHGAAMSELEGGKGQDDQAVAAQIDLRSYQTSLRSAQVIAVEARWSACMAGYGHRYGTPVDAFNDPAWRRSATASRAEIATAVDDIRCKWQTNLIGVWVSVETQFQRDQIAQRQSALDLERGLNSQELTAAAGVVDHGGS